MSNPSPVPHKDGPDTQKLTLSKQDWDRYVQNVSDPQAKEPQSQRATPRYKKIMQCVIRVAHEDHPQVYMIHSRDIANGGMGFLHNEAFPIDAICTIVLETNAGEGQVVEGQVSWARDTGGGVFAIGLKFDQPLDLTDFIDVDQDDEATAA